MFKVGDYVEIVGIGIRDEIIKIHPFSSGNEYEIRGFEKRFLANEIELVKEG